MSIEEDFDIPFVAGLALREKQIQQNYRPIIAVHKWFARRPGTLFRALLLAEFGEGSVRDTFYIANDLKGVTIADPFMGGGTPLIEANRLGCNVVGYDINPMAQWIVRQEIEWLDLPSYQDAAAKLVKNLQKKIGGLYQTRCLKCRGEAPVKYFLWVKRKSCTACGRDVDLFPGYVLSENRRHPRNVLVCSRCRELTETDDLKKPGACASCGEQLVVEGPARKGRCPCPACNTVNRYPDPKAGPPRHSMFGIEYRCHRCNPKHQGRFFKKPDADDLARFVKAETMLSRMKSAYIPPDEIPPGDETNRLHRWGYRRYREMFNERQLVGLETAARMIAKSRDERVRNALATNLSDLLRYQNMLCRYDTGVLKSLDIFSVHGFPVSLVQCESNMLGIVNGGGQPDLFGVATQGGNVGSGGWTNIIDKYTKAKAYCERPFEVRHDNGRKTTVPIVGEWIGDVRPDTPGLAGRKVSLRCESSTKVDLPAASIDAVLTDPPYFSNVQYAELMDFCFVWLKRLVGRDEKSFAGATTRSGNELTGNQSMERGLGHFAQGISDVFSRMAQALKPVAPLVFTYHNNALEAYFPIAVGILDAGLICTATLPCPAEMAASIHISGTRSSVVDSIFVCRAATRPVTAFKATPAVLAELVRADSDILREGGVDVSLGDLRCILYGHVIRLAISHLHGEWKRDVPVESRIGAVSAWIQSLGKLPAVEKALEMIQPPVGKLPGRKQRRARDAKVSV